MKKNSYLSSCKTIVYVYAKSLFDGRYHYGILGKAKSNVLYTFLYLRFNSHINRLDWVSGETSDFIILRSLSKDKQLNILW